jgi:DtxR family transcriptional regulator, Mn-dependent transcriptional regulator
MQDYMREIYKLSSEGERVSTSALAARMQVAPPSATAMIKRLARLGLAEHEPYRGVVLTPTGTTIALELIRHHRLIEQYLADTLGVPIEAVHAEADRLEHALSEELEARIDKLLGFPTHDPHGDPIPDARLAVEQAELRSLATLEPGEQAVVRRVPSDDANLLRYLASLALIPGKLVMLRSAAPFDGPITVRADGGEHAISRALALRIGVA